MATLSFEHWTLDADANGVAGVGFTANVVVSTTPDGTGAPADLSSGDTAYLSVNGNPSFETTYLGSTINFDANLSSGFAFQAPGGGTVYIVASEPIGDNAQYIIDPTDSLLVCFAAGTLIATPDGEKPVESLQTGDLVWTVDHGYQPVRWIGSRNFSKGWLAVQPSLRPIRIAAGALGDDLPSADLLVSPQHRVMIRSKIAQRMFGCDEILVAAKHLLELDGIEVADAPEGVTYYHILFDRHELVLSNGAVTESLYTGKEALKGVSAEARAEIFAIFPELRDAEQPAAAARMLVPGRMGRKLAERHHRNGQKLVSQ